MKVNRIAITERESVLINRLDHPIYTLAYIDYWGNIYAKVDKNPQEALMAMGALGYYEAIKQIVDKELC